MRRESWDPDVKCKAYFSIFNKTIPESVPDDPEFDEYISFFDCLDNGDFLEDDWESGQGGAVNQAAAAASCCCCCCQGAAPGGEASPALGG